MSKLKIPFAEEHLNRLQALLENQTPFHFVRFSDGETEILHNRYLEIGQGKTVFRGRTFGNEFPAFDSKRFDPRIHQELRSDLLASATYRDEYFFKGIPTSHNNAIIDREFMLRLNGGFSSNITFSDLFLNSNYECYRDNIVPLFSKFKHIYVVANYRSKLVGELSNAKLIEVPDNFFNCYQETLDKVMHELIDIEAGALVLSSASSLTNIIGHKLHTRRQDIILIDIGTSINDLLSLDSRTRAYHLVQGSLIAKLKYKLSKGYKITW
ncbi:hypothetical protein [Vibrio salinus]|uniref:hypothetical protein n=1 Tax=Vibrio salinus TaxID=2899784 RepID=UPI001E40CBA4|nr:hypothetical protein [Vibrio salinus]MCE0493766.1 hypothetical protein [Vibrio salinus]